MVYSVFQIRTFLGWLFGHLVTIDKNGTKCFSFLVWLKNIYIRYSYKVTSHSFDIFEYESSACRVQVKCVSGTSRVDLLICINSSYSVKTTAQRKDSPCNAIAWTNIVRLDGFFNSKLYFLISLDTRQNA